MSDLTSAFPAWVPGEDTPKGKQPIMIPPPVWSPEYFGNGVWTRENCIDTAVNVECVDVDSLTGAFLGMKARCDDLAAQLAAMDAWIRDIETTCASMIEKEMVLFAELSRHATDPGEWSAYTECKRAFDAYMDCRTKMVGAALTRLHKHARVNLREEHATLQDAVRTVEAALTLPDCNDS